MHSQEIRAQVIITGKVQGVGFRAWVQKVARERSLSGEVQNQSDGTVKAILEGDDLMVKEVLDLCKDGPKAARVDRTDVSFEQFVGEYDGFRITSS